MNENPFNVLLLNETERVIPLEVLDSKEGYENYDDAMEAAIVIAYTYGLTAVVVTRQRKGWLSRAIMGVNGRDGLSVNCYNKLDC